MRSSLSWLKNVRGSVRVWLAGALAALVAVPACLWAAAPTWWADHDVLRSNVTPDDYAVVNQGQVKHIAKQAYEEMKAQGLISPISNSGAPLVQMWESPSAGGDNYHAVNIGQLKNVAKPFYDLLIAKGLVNDYPWAGSAGDNYALANIGQVKNLFSFEIPSVVEVPINLVVTPTSPTTANLTWDVGPNTSTIVQVSTDGGGTWQTLAVLPAGAGQYSAAGLPDEGTADFRIIKSVNGAISPSTVDWMQANGLDPSSDSLDQDNDDDGLSDAEESVRGTNPNAEDTDSDGVSDAADGWPRDPMLSPAILPPVRYAVVRLNGTNGVPVSVPQSVYYHVISLDDSGAVLYAKGTVSGNGMNQDLGVWEPGVGANLIPGLDNISSHWVQVPFYEGIYRAFDRMQSSDGWIAATSYQATDGVKLYHKDHGIISIEPSAPPNEVPDVTARWLSLVSVTSQGKLLLTGRGWSHTSSPSGGQNFGISFPVLGPSGADRNETWSEVTFNSGWNNPVVSGFPCYRPLLFNDEGLTMGCIVTIDPHFPGESMEVIPNCSALSLQESMQASYFLLGSGAPALALGEKDGAIWRAVRHADSNTWDERPLIVWNAEQQSEQDPAALSGISAGIAFNRRREMLFYNTQTEESGVVRNGVLTSLGSLITGGWADAHGIDINNHGVILATATRTHDDQGDPLSNPQPEPVLLVPLELASEDRLVKGSITIPEGSANVALSFRATETDGLDLGTFSGLEPGVSDSPTYIYASEENILSEAELDDALAGTLDPRANSQAVLFYRDADNPRRLHFATAFDQVGDIEISLSFGSGTTPAVAKLRHTLTAQDEAASVIATFDQRIESMVIPEIIDYDLDVDGDGVPDGGKTDMITAAQPGTMDAPGAFVSEASEDNPENLVLLVNSDDDNANGQADYLHTDLDPADDDVAQIILRRPADLESLNGTLTLTHNGGSALRLRFATGPPIASGISVNLAAPTGALAALSESSLTLYAEGLAPSSDVSITLSYTSPGESVSTISDTVRLTIADPALLVGLQTKHRYFFSRGDLGGFMSRVYANNGSYRQYRLGLAPVGESAPLQNRGFLSKSLFKLIGTLKNTAAFYRGIPDGFWLGLKGDWEGIQQTGEAIGSAIAFVFVEDDSGRLARAVAIYDQVKEVTEIFKGIPRSQIIPIIEKMVTTISRDLYTDAEAALGWEPIIEGVDAQVINYMAGVATGYITEQIAMSLVPGGGQVARITSTLIPLVRSVVVAVKNTTRFAMPALASVSKSSSWVYRGIQKIIGSGDEAKQALAAVQKVKRRSMPDGRVNPVVAMNTRLKHRPELFDEVLDIWAQWLPRPISDKQIDAVTTNFGRIIELTPTPADLSDDAIRSFARFYGSIGRNPDLAARNTKYLAKAFRAGDDFDASSFDNVGFDLVMKQLRSNYSLRPGTHDTWVSNVSGVVYGPDNSYGSRIIHLFAHSVPEFKSGDHSVFSVPRGELLSLIDEAFSRPRMPAYRKDGITLDPEAFIVDMGKPIGESGTKLIRVVTVGNPAGKVLRTAFPVDN